MVKDILKQVFRISLWVFVIYEIMWFFIDDLSLTSFLLSPEEYAVDYILSLSFTIISYLIAFFTYRIVGRGLQNRNRVRIAIITIFIINNLIIIVMMNIGIKLWNEKISYDADILYVFGVLSMFVTLFAVTNNYIADIIQKEKDNQTAKFQAEQARLQSEMAMLKQQIQPHFMFNNLSTLSALVMEGDTDKTLTFIENLSKVLRYVLQNQQKNLVTVHEEMDFVRNYFYLMKIRYDNKVSLDITPEAAVCKGNLPPATLQMLVENCLKHNKKTLQQPLHITIDGKDGFISVSNNYAPMQQNGPVSGTGLRNLKDRYKLLCSQEVITKCDMKTFCVLVPIINYIES